MLQINRENIYPVSKELQFNNFSSLPQLLYFYQRRQQSQVMLSIDLTEWSKMRITFDYKTGSTYFLHMIILFCSIKLKGTDNRELSSHYNLK